MRSILIPLDGSAFSATALPMAVKLARAAGARIKLVRVHEPFLALVPAVEVPMPAPPDDAELRKQEETHLAETAAALGVVGPSKVEHELLVGLAANALTEAIERDRPDLVVMSTHGRGPLSRFWLGSVADHLVRHVSVPLLLLRPSEDEKLPAEPAIRSILVPLDLSGSAESILGPVTELAQITRAKVTLLHVLEPILGIGGALPSYPVVVPDELMDSSRKAATGRLETAARPLRALGIQVETEVAVGVGVAGTVLELLQQGDHDLVAMATHGAGGMKRLLVGSVADKVVRGSDRPVLVLRPEGG
ncbi:MAG: universal stress protein [Gemmatimonadales bacterium]